MSIFLPFGFGKRNDSINNAFYYTGKDQTFNFVGGFTYTIYAWGAAGSTNNGTYGGYGAYITGVFSPSTSGTATIIVGQVGQGGTSITSVFYGGGAGGSSGSLGNGHGGGYPGGGRCSFKVNTTEIVTCGGGGGGANGGGTGGNGGAVYSSGTFTGNGGSGTGTGSAGGGGGGTSSSGGGAGGSYDPGDIAGYKDTGGYGAVNAGGGGGGYYGGGGGGNNSGIGGGGGGSSYINTAYFSCISAAQGNAIPVLASFTSGSTVYNLYNAAGYPAGVASSANTGSALIIIIQNPATFKPTYLPGCTLWLDGADTSSNSMTFSSGSNLSTWKDKSGNGNNFSLTSGTTSNITDNGYSVISFPNGAVMTSANTVSISSNSSLFVVSKLTSMSAATIDMLIGFPSINSGDFSVRFGAAGLAGTPANTGGSGYEFGYSNYYVNGIFNPSNALSFYSNVYTLIDASAQSTTGTSTITLSSSFLSRYFIGNIAEFIYYANSALTTAQRRKIEMYLAWKWGLTTPLSTFSPANISGLNLWLDAADSSTVLLSGSNVTQWNDKSGNGNNFAQSTSSAQPTYVSNSLSFNGTSNYLYQSKPSQYILNNLSAWTIFSVQKINTAAGGTQIVYRYGIRGILYESISTTYYFFNYSPIAVSGSGDGIAAVVVANATETGYINGVSQGSATGPTTTGQDAFTLGASNASSGFLNGYIYEIIMFNTALTTTQRQQVEGYLAWKWGLQGNIPSTHPSYYAPPASQVVFTPLQISGLTTWFDAADSSSWTLTGSNITKLYDKTGNNNTLTAAATSNGPIVSNSAFYFNGTTSYLLNSALSSTLTVSNGFTIFTLMNTVSNTTAYDRLLSVNEDLNTNGLVWGTSNGYFIVDIGNASGWTNGATIISPNINIVGSNVIACSTFASSGIIPYINGTTYNTRSSTNNQPIRNLYLGSAYYGASPTQFWKGYLQEVLIYSSVLSTTQRQQVEGYLAWKWGLQANLPSSHPYYKISP